MKIEFNKNKLIKALQCYFVSAGLIPKANPLAFKNKTYHFENL